jgi:SAM-dependent methyltransferase
MTESAPAPALRNWERAEIVRSNVEATGTSAASLRTSERNISRYMAPSAETPYPLEYAYHLLGDARGKCVLDFGCGSGMNSLMLARRGARVIGVDISISLVQLARQRLAANKTTGASFVVGSAHDLPLPDRSVDVLFGIAILHHLDLERVSHEVARVLRSGGRAIFQEPVRNSRLVRSLRRLVPYRAADVSPFERPLTDAELQRFGRPFTSMRQRAFMLPHVNVIQLLPPVRRYLDRCYRADARWLRRYPRLSGYAGIRVIELTR